MLVKTTLHAATSGDKVRKIKSLACGHFWHTASLKSKEHLTAVGDAGGQTAE